MSAEQTRQAMTRYWDSNHTDLSMLAPDVVFTTMATGEDHRGPDAVRRMLEHVYHVAFDARADFRTKLFGEDQAMVEGEIVGTHIGEFAGVPATGKAVRVPLCVVYDLDDGLIKRARIYLEMATLMRQLRG